MVQIIIHRVAVMLGLIAIFLGSNHAIRGEDFRVENAVYQGEETTPSLTSTTIFHDKMVYDCMNSPAETVVFDKNSDRLVLLNLKKRIRTELTTTQLADLVDRLQALGAKSKEPLVKFLSEPKFQEGVEEATGELVLKSPLVTYRVALSPESNPGVAEQYHEFCDYCMRLNAVLSPGSLPPFGRLVVNAAIAARQTTPSQVLRTLVSQDKDHAEIIVRSEHRVVAPLESADLERVKRTHEQMGSFKLVGFHQYRKTELK